MIADKEAELAFVQGVLLLGEESSGRLNAEIAAQEINEDCFTEKSLYRVYQAAREVSRKGQRLDPFTISASTSDGEARVLVKTIWPEYSGPTSLGILGDKLREYASRRAAVAVGRKIIQAAEDTGGNFHGDIVAAATAIGKAYSGSSAGIQQGEEVLQAFYEDLESGRDGVHIRSGISSFDKMVGGLPRSFVTVLGAYPGCFKSGIVATIAGNIASSGTKVGLFSLEDSPTWIAKRYVSRATGIPVQVLTGRPLNQQEKERVAATQDNVVKIVKNILIDGRSGLTGYDVSASARYMVQQGCEVILIDHLGEIQAAQKRQTRYDLEVAENVRLIRNVAKDTGCAILLAAHLRRGNNEDGEDIYRVPKLTDFSDSSAIEKMTRLALGLYQPKDNVNEVALKVLKQNEGAARGTEFRIEKDANSALVKNG